MSRLTIVIGSGWHTAPRWGPPSLPAAILSRRHDSRVTHSHRDQDLKKLVFNGRSQAVHESGREGYGVFETESRWIRDARNILVIFYGNRTMYLVIFEASCRYAIQTTVTIIIKLYFIH